MTEKDQIEPPAGFKLADGSFSNRLSKFRKVYAQKGFKHISSIVDVRTRCIVDQITLENEDVINWQIVAFAIAGVVFFCIVFIVIRVRS